MKKYLLPEGGSFYKANLHSHTTVSDGANTPSKMKEYYKAHGYSILAMTDHELLVDHSELNDPDFLTVTGYEYAFVEPVDYPYAKTLELNFFAKNPHNETQICFNPQNVIHGERYRCDTLKYVGEIYERKFNMASVQYVIDRARENGFLVSLNHPSYSFITPELFGSLNGLFAMEIHNQGSYYSANDFNSQMYDQMLRLGHRISCIAADDNHRAYVYDDKNDIRPWGFSMIKANSLTYENVIAALENGDFYASQGPEIYELYTENGRAKIVFSAAKTVAMLTKYRHCAVEQAPVGEYLTSAEFVLPDDEYMRFEITDAHGRRAATRAYFADEFCG